MLRSIRNIFTKKSNQSDFELAFEELKAFEFQNINQSIPFFKLLNQLQHSTSKEDADELISVFKSIKYSSNTSSVFNFYFPIVSYILFYKPEYEEQILGILIGPNFANGTTEVADMIQLIQSAQNFKIKENPKYLTPESQYWITNTLPQMIHEVDREIQRCWKELKECPPHHSST